jgi:hypothetical protein
LSSNSISKSANAHAALAVSSKRVLPCKAGAAWTPVGLVSRMDFGVALEVVLADEAFSATIALKLSIS